MYDELVKLLRKLQYMFTPEYVCRTIGEAADAIEELNKPKWISVTERLPDDHESVLVYNPQYQITVGYIYGDGQFRVRAVLFPETPTYWMPLPLPPEEGNQ